MTEDNEWTFVPLSSKSKGRRRDGKEANHPRTTRGGDRCGISGGFYQNSAQSTQQRPKDELNERKRVESSILECLGALERQFRSSNKGFARTLMDALSRTCTEQGDELVDTTTNSIEEKNKAIRLRDIVAYGIGNFASNSYSAPMLQFACLLLLRRVAATSEQTKFRHDISENNSLSDAENTFQLEQQHVPIFYYEPCITPLEKQMLETTFHVTVLDTNDLGKLTVESMRQLALPNTAAATAMNSYNAATLFYMPHCPMRLYCNVLWAHWDHVVSDKATKSGSQKTTSTGHPILIFGNSFHSYEERTISSEKRLDPTNGVFGCVSFTNEVSVYVSSDNKDTDDALQYLEMAFNDCNIISFLKQCEPVERPKEYFPSEDPYENGELI
jgi:hypothetical protein